MGPSRNDDFIDDCIRENGITTAQLPDSVSRNNDDNTALDVDRSERSG
jgi:hypothetical protein